MFQMMNSARINTGVSGMGIASTAYLNALAYTLQRRQGRDITGSKTGDVAIIDHPDVRRMLLWMKASVDGMRSMIYSCAFWQDFALELPQGSERDHYANLVDFMTPIIKACCSEWGFRVCETAIQCLGGYGYCKDYPLEQYLRDVKILSLYEGTNGIQAMDLLGRKMIIREGACYQAFRTEIMSFCRKHQEHTGLGQQIKALAKAMQQLHQTTGKMADMKKKDPLQWASRSYPMLMVFGEISMAWRLLDMALVACDPSRQKGRKKDFYRGKVFQARFFVDETLPRTLATMNTCLREGREVVDMPERAF
jgi:hypothetical protein